MTIHKILNDSITDPNFDLVPLVLCLAKYKVKENTVEGSEHNCDP